MPERPIRSRPAKGGFLDEPSSVERLWEEFKVKASADAASG